MMSMSIWKIFCINFKDDLISKIRGSSVDKILDICETVIIDEYSDLNEYIGDY